MGNGNAAIQCGLPVGRRVLPTCEWAAGDAGAVMSVAVHLGGYAAEWRLIGAAPPARHWPWESRDYRNAVAVATTYWGAAKSSPAVQNAVRRAQREAKRMLELPEVWAAATALAESLIWDGSVGGDVASDILDGHLGAGWLPALPEGVSYLFSTRFNLETELRRIASGHGLGIERQRVLPVHLLIRSAVESGLLSAKLGEAIRGVFSVCTPAIHGETVTPAQVDFVRDVAPELILALRAIN